MMKKMLSLVFALLLCMSTPLVAFAATDVDFVIDELGLLSVDDVEKLNDRAAEIYEERGVGVFFCYLYVDSVSGFDVTAVVGDMQDYVFMAENEENWYLHTAGKGDSVSADDLRAVYDYEETYAGGVSAYLDAAAEYFPVTVSDNGASEGDDSTLTVGATDNGAPFLLDAAELLTESEEDALVKKLTDVSKTYNTHVAVATVYSVEERDMDDAVENFYDLWGYGYGADKSGVLLLISMDVREFRILSNGAAAPALTLDRIDAITNDITPYLSDGDYAAAFELYAEKCGYYLDGHINGFAFEFGKWILIALGVGVAVGLVVALVLKGQLKSVHRQERANVYVREGSMRLTQSGDYFMYRTVTRTAKPKNNSSGGSGSGSRNVGGGKF